MTAGEARALLGMILGSWPKMYLDDFGERAWLDFLEKQECGLATEAYARLSERQRELPTIADLRNMIRAVEADKRSAVPALPEAPYVRDPPAWVKGWGVARYGTQPADLRVWPQQKPGYDSIQTWNPHGRSHVWPDQEQMPPPEQERYGKLGAHLTADDVTSALGNAVPEKKGPTTEETLALLADI